MFTAACKHTNYVSAVYPSTSYIQCRNWRTDFSWIWYAYFSRSEPSKI